MKKNEMDFDLFCLHCKEEVDHHFTYINDEISKVQCTQCGHVLEFKVDLMKEFSRELYEKIARKPHRLTEEYKEDFSKFLFSMPIRIVKKPYAVYKYIKDTKEVFSDYHKKDDKKES
ncbi:bh protein [Pseudalkalibacillus caeni]|uniref:Bh protein n=1 Tax=Exobacillus caeni TaxID=2574798 RepID=A0A5R9F8Y3_9BACL|nr:bh protein [Pseudalkalibacillus caeni]TLS38720.1 bh protein [Pseudalkalibacillus caeni]